MMTLALEQRHPVLKDFGVFGSRLSEVFRLSVSALEGGRARRSAEEGKKKEIIEDKKGCPFGMIIFTT